MNRWNIKMTILFQFWIYMSFFFLLTGQNISEFEKVLRTIRDLWYSPDNNSNVGDIQYLHNYYKFIQRYVQCSLFNFMWNYFFSFLYGFIAGYLSGMNLIDSSVIIIRIWNQTRAGSISLITVEFSHRKLDSFIFGQRYKSIYWNFRSISSNEAFHFHICTVDWVDGFVASIIHGCGKSDASLHMEL